MIEDDTALTDTDGILRGYAQDSDTLIDRYESLTTEDVFAPVSRFVKTVRGDVLDVGAGTGRDATWFAQWARTVVAVEPVAAFRQFAQKRSGVDRITWLEDRLPDLKTTLSLKRQFDLITAIAVWQHLDVPTRTAALVNLRALAREDAHLILSIRDGSGSAVRPVFPAQLDHTLSSAQTAGFELVERVDASSAQEANRAAGVTWTWLVLRACEVSRTP